MLSFTTFIISLSLQVDEKVFKVERLSGLNPGLSRPSVTCSLSWNVPLHPGSHSEDSAKGTRTTSASREQRKCTQGVVCELSLRLLQKVGGVACCTRWLQICLNFAEIDFRSRRVGGNLPVCTSTPDTERPDCQKLPLPVSAMIARCT